MSYAFPERKRLRWADYDYSSPGSYFVTMCVKDWLPWFGEIIGGKMMLNGHGEMVDDLIYQIPNVYKNAKLHAHMVMPDHLHILIGLAPLQGSDSIRPEQITQNYGTTSKIVHDLKMIVTKQMRQKFNKQNFAWQRSYFDRIIKDETHFMNTKKYILDNPKNWAKGTGIVRPEQVV